MRCCCCNVNLSDYESVLRHPETNEFLDTCKKCLVFIPINPLVPDRLLDDTGYEDDDDGVDFTQSDIDDDYNSR